MSLNKTVTVSRETEVHELARRVSRQVFTADTIIEASDIIETQDPDLIILDRRFTPHLDRFLTAAERISNAPVVIVGNDNEDADSFAELRKMGAYDYLRGKTDHDRLEEIAARISEQPKTETPQTAANLFFADDFAESIEIVGRSEAIKTTLKMIKLVAASKCDPVLIVGETGTGKELAARAVHTLRHPDQPFVAVNCAALTANLLESELFGHVKGAFTGADREKMGLLELAATGTLFLDEISEMPIDLQAKLLRVIQERTFRKVGGTKDIQSTATVIASSNRNLKKEAQANRFRHDLYYRLCVAPITLAPLRSPRQMQDIPLLAEYFLKTSSICPEKCDKIRSLTKLALETLERHNWPGNIRELRNVIDRAIIYEQTNKIGVNSIVIDPSDLDSALAGDAAAPGRLRNYSLAKAERELISRALRETGWQKTKAASLLGITRATLYAKVKQYNIEQQPQPAQSADDLLYAPEPLAAL
ncbi:MAG: sigma-54-dependent Fis family transcriptional regulator [Sedimentisphaerales bacterium]|nr:sigma-54-dependent Fis family transcriptional regulator [Sedimentisphaerales bacterium]